MKDRNYPSRRLLWLLHAGLTVCLAVVIASDLYMLSGAGSLLARTLVTVVCLLMAVGGVVLAVVTDTRTRRARRR